MLLSQEFYSLDSEVYSLHTEIKYARIIIETVWKSNSP